MKAREPGAAPALKKELEEIRQGWNGANVLLLINGGSFYTKYRAYSDELKPLLPPGFDIGMDQFRQTMDRLSIGLDALEENGPRQSVLNVLSFDRRYFFDAANALTGLVEQGQRRINAKREAL